MLNLEWLRTFRTVYKTKSLSRAAELLMISQPTVSQQIAMLESRIGQKLFVRKSKGVIETDMGRMLNTLVSGSIEVLEGVERSITKAESNLKTIISFGISEHLYKTVFHKEILNLGEYVHLKFGDKRTLIKDVEEGRLLYAVIPDSINTFDTICHKIMDQNVVLVGTPEIDFSDFKKYYQKDKEHAQAWLKQFKWYAHDSNSNFIKIYWLTVFDKKRPSIIPNYIIPNEYQILVEQSKRSGLSVAFDSSVRPFIQTGQLQSCEVKRVTYRELSLISNKKKADPAVTEKIIELLS